MGPFATATEFCEYTGIPVPTDLARLQAILDLASAVIRAFCDQQLSYVANDQVTLQPIDRDTLILPERPVLGVSGVVAGGAAQTSYTWTRSGLLTRSANWVAGATVVYTHGYLETDPGFVAIRSVCMDAASRAFTLNERSASEAMASTLMESAGYSPEVFLTQGEMYRLADFGKVLVG